MYHQRILIASFLALALAAAWASAAEAGLEDLQPEAPAAAADDPHAHHRAMLNKPATAAKTTSVDLREALLLNQDGEQVHFVEDVIGDHIVVMDFVYTTCTTICPILTAVMGQVQSQLGGRMGNDVVLVSVSVDPTRDTPQRLKAYAVKHKVGPGWSWLTGPKSVMEDVLTGLGAYSPNYEEHAAMVLVGDGRSGEWSRFFGFPNPKRIVERVDELLAARGLAEG